jgi:phosphate transport system permease protein
MVSLPRTAVTDQRRTLRTWTRDDTLALIGAGLSSLALVFIVYVRILPFSGVLGFLVCWYVTFLGLYAALTSVTNSAVVVRDRLATWAIYAGAGLVGLTLLSAIIYTVWEGFPALPHLNFYSEDMSGVRPNDSFDRGGVLHAVAGTLIEIAIACVISVPLGIGTAIYMTEFRGRLAVVVRTIVEAMTALPSVVAGLFAYTVLIITFGLSRSGFVASIAITLMILPIIARASYVVLRVVPGGLREAGLALGSSQWRTVWHVILPTARQSLATAVILGIARGIGETSPVLLTSGASTFYNGNPFQYTMNSLPLFVFTAVRSGEPAYVTRGYAAASVLLVVVLILFILTRLLARQKGNR